jgi:outer membrane biosynthesis protein TonB
MDKAVTLSVNEKGEVFYNKDKITLAQLPMRLQTLKSTSKDPKVIINSDAGADFKHVVAVLDEVAQIGIARSASTRTRNEARLGVRDRVRGLPARFVLSSAAVLPRHDEDQAIVQQVELLSDVESEKPKDEKKPESRDEARRGAEDARTRRRPMRPRSCAPRRVAVERRPALEAASLGAIEAALNGEGGGGDFAQAFDFASGGRIGGTGKARRATRSSTRPSAWPRSTRSRARSSRPRRSIPPRCAARSSRASSRVLSSSTPRQGREPARREVLAHRLRAPALDAIKRWKFEPGLRAGQRVPSKMRISIRFPANQP